MFNQTSNNFNYTTRVNINAVSGTLLKNHPRSFFKTLDMESQYGKNILSDDPHYYDEKRDFGDRTVKVVVLQAMLCGDNKVMCEIVEEKFYIIEDK